MLMKLHDDFERMLQTQEERFERIRKFTLVSCNIVKLVHYIDRLTIFGLFACVTWYFNDFV